MDVLKNMFNVFPQNKNKKNVLTLDGGGIKGIALIMVMKHIFNDNLPANYIDFFSGTSTGGMISLYLSMGGNLRDALAIYLLMNPLFMTTSSAEYLINKSARFSDLVVENEFKNIFGNLKISDMFVENTHTQEYPLFAITTQRVDVHPSESTLFTNYKINKKTYSKINSAYLWEIARCTSAAPTYWPPYTRSIDLTYELENNIIFSNLQEKRKFLSDESWVMIDGGVGNNNPSLIALTEIINVYGIENINCMLSIGCGKEQRKYADEYKSLKHINFNERVNAVMFGKYIITFLDAIYDVYNEFIKIYNDFYPNIDSIIDNLDGSDEDKINMKKKIQNKEYLEKLNEKIVDIGYIKTIIAEVLYKVDQTINIPKNIASGFVGSIGQYTIESPTKQKILEFVFKFKLFSALLDQIPFGNIVNMGATSTSTIPYAYIAYELRAYLNLIIIIMDGCYKGIFFLIDSLTNYRDELLHQISKDTTNNLGGVIRVINSIIRNLKVLTDNPTFSYSKHRKYISTYIHHNGEITEVAKKTLKLKLGELKHLFAGAIIGAATETENDNVFLDTALNTEDSKAYFRYTANFEEEFDLAETDPIKLMNMMRETYQYINYVDSNGGFDDVKTKIMQNKRKYNIVPIIEKNFKKDIGIYINKNIEIETERIISKLGISVYSGDIISMLILKHIIHITYLKYYEAKYLLLTNLLDYETNNILSGISKKLSFDYLNVNNENITVEYTIKEIIDILTPNINNIQTGGYLINFSEFTKIHNVNTDVHDTPTISATNSQSFREIYDSIIISQMPRNSDNNIKCGNCKKILSNDTVKYECNDLNNLDRILNSNSYYFWNTCNNLRLKYNAISDMKSGIIGREIIKVNIELSNKIVNKFTYNNSKISCDIAKDKTFTITHESVGENYTPILSIKLSTPEFSFVIPQFTELENIIIDVSEFKINMENVLDKLFSFIIGKKDKDIIERLTVLSSTGKQLPIKITLHPCVPHLCNNIHELVINANIKNNIFNYLEDLVIYDYFIKAQNRFCLKLYRNYIKSDEDSNLVINVDNFILNENFENIFIINFPINDTEKFPELTKMKYVIKYEDSDGNLLEISDIVCNPFVTLGLADTESKIICWLVSNAIPRWGSSRA